MDFNDIYAYFLLAGVVFILIGLTKNSKITQTINIEQLPNYKIIL